MTGLILAAAVILLLAPADGSQESCLHKLNLVARDVTPSDIVKHSSLVCDNAIKYFSGITIGHVSPWHPRGKALSLQYAKKFDVISPFWYSIEFHDGKYVVSLRDLTRRTDRGGE